jgi:16S rRNA (uracil1498-N3)-methyltransferase
MPEYTPRHRLFVDADLANGVEVMLGEAQAHYLLNVLRSPLGAEICLFNGRDGEWRGVLTESAKKKAKLRLTDCLAQQRADADLWLLFAPIKRTRIDLIVEKATELGVSLLQPVFTERTVMTRVGEDRLRLIAIEASEQCERLTVPDLRPAVTLSKILSEWPSDRTLFVMDETGGGRPIASVFADRPAGPAALMIGPEGGFTKSELDGLSRLAFSTRVGLGRRILRADTAVIAALACYQALCGEWRNSTPA